MTDTNALGTKDGTSVVTHQSALKEALERVTAWFAPKKTLAEAANPTDIGPDIDLILATLSSQAESLEAMALALEPFDPARVLEPNGIIIGLERFDFERAHQALTQYRKTGDL